MYTSHAVERMLRRKITVEDVWAIINNFDGKIPQSIEKSILYKHFAKRSDNLLAVVVVIHKNARAEVITVMNHFEVKV